MESWSRRSGTMNTPTLMYLANSFRSANSAAANTYKLLGFLFPLPLLHDLCAASRGL